MRLGILLDDDHYAASYWYHLKCFHFKPRHKVLDVETLDKKICGFDEVNKDDAKGLIEYLKEELMNLKENKSGKKKTAKKVESNARS